MEIFILDDDNLYRKSKNCVALICMFLVYIYMNILRYLNKWSIHICIEERETFIDYYNYTVIYRGYMRYRSYLYMPWVILIKILDYGWR